VIAAQGMESNYYSPESDRKSRRKANSDRAPARTQMASQTDQSQGRCLLVTSASTEAGKQKKGTKLITLHSF
jgi:hypothetical protein